MGKHVLVPYDDIVVVQQLLVPALKLAEQLCAEVILLRINLPINPETGEADHERLYSELKALQIRLEALATGVSL